MSKIALAALVAGTALLGASAIATAQSTDALVDKYTTLAGSKDNAQLLVNGLRTSSDFKIGTTSFATPAKPLGNGEINIALSLTEAKLGQQNIGNPTTAQLEAALESVLQARADGQGWGQIANAMGIHLGDVMRSEKAHGQDQLARTERPERSARPEKVERPEKPERFERPERPERPEHPERPARGR